MDPGSSPGVPDLVARIAGEIRDRGPMPFDRFMDLALHDREHFPHSFRRLIIQFFRTLSPPVKKSGSQTLKT